MNRHRFGEKKQVLRTKLRQKKSQLGWLSLVGIDNFVLN